MLTFILKRTCHPTTKIEEEKNQHHCLLLSLNCLWCMSLILILSGWMGLDGREKKKWWVIHVGTAIILYKTDNHANSLRSRHFGFRILSSMGFMGYFVTLSLQPPNHHRVLVVYHTRLNKLIGRIVHLHNVVGDEV